jgi:hypothetical protein
MSDIVISYPIYRKKREKILILTCFFSVSYLDKGQDDSFADVKLSIQDHNGVEKGTQIQWLRIVFAIMFLALLLRGYESLIWILIFSLYRFFIDFNFQNFEKKIR